MPKEDLLSLRKPLNEICKVPDKIISVYSLEKHVWADSNADAARKTRQPELKTIQEFQIDPVRPFLNDILRQMAAPYKPDQRDNPIGQGYWIQAEFGSGKSHLLCFLSALALGNEKAWQVVKEKEDKAGRGKRESLYRFWEEGIAQKSGKPNRGIFVMVKTLVGSGSGTVGVNEKGKRLTEYILDAAKEQLEKETGKNLSLYPVELLADRFIAQDLNRYRGDLKKFLKDPRFFVEDEYEEVDDFIRDLQANKSPDYKKSVGNRLWRFYTEYLQVTPQIAAETEDVLKHLVETILAEGYSGVLLVLDEVSLFMKNRDEDQRVDDEKTLVVLANRLAKVHNLPIWTVSAAQQAIESKMGVKNIIADDRLRLVELLKNPNDYYDIVLARVREITNPQAISAYFQYYRRGFTWPNAVGEEQFAHFFPFQKSALEVLRDVTYNLTTTRSAIAVMHQVLKHQLRTKGNELIRLWELFDETVKYEEDPSGTFASLSAIKTRFETDYRAYEACRRQIDGLTKGVLKVHREKAQRTIQTLFLYYIAKTRQQGLSPEEIANSVMIERDAESNPDENNQHYETITENLKRELRQVVQTFDEDRRPRYRFEAVFTGVDPREEFRKARDEAEGNEVMQREAWAHLLGLDEWPVKTRTMTLDLSNGVKSMFREIAPFEAAWRERTLWRREGIPLEVNWKGRYVSGLVGMKDLGRLAADHQLLPQINTAETDYDFAVYVGLRAVSPKIVQTLLEERQDPRIIVWTPDELTSEEKDRLIDFAAYRKLVSDWGGKETEDALAVINWAQNALQVELGKMENIVNTSYARGHMDALDNSLMEFHVAGELGAILQPLVDRVLTATYESRDLVFESFAPFRKEEGVKVINGIVKTGQIPKGAKPNQDISAAQNFGFGLKIMKKSAERMLDTSGNPHIADMWQFIDSKLADDGQAMKLDTLYKNFMGIGGPKNFGLTRRMVQIYLLTLVRDSKVRVGVGPRSGLPFLSLDYTNLADVDFSVKVLDNLTEIQKLARPENWEVLRPYAEKLLTVSVPANADDRTIAEFRGKLREHLTAEQPTMTRLVTLARALFESLQATNPYAQELAQVTAFYENTAAGENEINVILHALQTAFGYKAFEAGQSAQTEVDDLANRLKNVRDLQRFVGFENELRAAHTYAAVILPDGRELKAARSSQRALAEKLRNLQPYIDSDVKLRTELIGTFPPQPGEHGTLYALVQEYTSVYNALHDQVLDRVETVRKTILALRTSEDLKALRALESVSAFQPAAAPQILDQLSALEDGLFGCDAPSHTSVTEMLRTNPIHTCGLTFQNAQEHIQRAEQAAGQAQKLVDETIERKMQVLLNPAVRERLDRMRDDERIAALLDASDALRLRSALMPMIIEQPEFADTLARYLKKIVVRHVRLADFKPSVQTIERTQVDSVVEEFRAFLESAFHVDRAKESGSDDTLPMVEIE